MELNKKNFFWFSGLIFVGVIIVWGVFNFATVLKGASFIWNLLLPFIVGFMIAYVLNIPMDFFRQRVFKKLSPRKAKNLSFVCIIVCSILILSFFFLILIPQFVRSIISLGESIPGRLAIIQKEIEKNPDIVPTIKEQISDITIDWSKISSQIVPIIQKNSGSFLSSAFDSVSSAIQSIVTFFVGLSIAIYLLTNSESAKASFSNIINAIFPKKIISSGSKVATISNKIFRHFIVVQCLECVIVAALLALGLSIAGIKYWLIFSILIGLLSIIPKLGSFIGLFFSVTIIFIEQGWVKVLIFLAIFIVVQLINENFIYSQLMMSTLKIPEIGIMISSIIGGALYGASGAIFFIPIFGVLYTLFKEYVYNRLTQKDIPLKKAGIPGEDELI